MCYSVIPLLAHRYSSFFGVLKAIVSQSGFLAAAVSLSRGPAEAPRGRCPDSSRPLSVSVAWDRRPGDAAGGATELPAGHATGSRGRHKVMAFVGIFTGFGSVGRRRALRRTWLPSDRQGLLRLEEATGLAFRFVIGKSNDKSKMTTLEREVEEYDDFVLLDLEDEYSRLPYKTLAFFKAACALFDSDFYVKADDDIYLRPAEQVRCVYCEYVGSRIVHPAQLSFHGRSIEFEKMWGGEKLYSKLYTNDCIIRVSREPTYWVDYLDDDCIYHSHRLDCSDEGENIFLKKGLPDDEKMKYLMEMGFVIIDDDGLS
ncbi:probable beta-1,3-galactosyltransferase 14 [Hordeum vulgare subsp. vulgare]|uniref:probable beta-1,3-galactosyltransferase 14 n=1 Tax=Hordeum vulgare subsp. vulgare TaxID=112509 RepID=UPI001D1A502E|nr:probable beta-1,3-galactosyltransferase 14 [Hordeum vulgare subsp. vulgare]